MKPRFMLSWLLICSFVFAFSSTVVAQNTVKVTTNRAGTLDVDQSALPIYTPPAVSGQVRSKSQAGIISLLTDALIDDKKGPKSFFCSTANARGGKSGTSSAKAVGALSCGTSRKLPCYWKKPLLVVGFINGTPELKEVVRETIAEWTTWANVGFILADNQNLAGDTADIKLRFSATAEHYSLVGIDSWMPFARQSKDDQTMNLGLIGEELRDINGQIVPWVKGTILHEFGHALGLQHEHQNPTGGIQWNRDAVIAELSGPPNNWDLQKIEHNVFRALSRTLTQFTQYDQYSIMHYPFPASWTRNGREIKENFELSETDKSFVSSVYPRSRTIINTAQTYQLTTWYNNRRNCLAIATPDGGATVFPYFVACDSRAPSQRWRFTRMPNGDYRITNVLAGARLSLNDDGLGYYSSMSSTGNYRNQYWTATSLDRYVRLSSMLNGQYYSLTTDPNANTRTFMSKTAHWANQLWELIPVR